MGLIKGLVLLPLAPVQGVAWLAERLQDEALRQLHDPDVILAELAELQAALDAGELTEQRYLELEEQLLDRLDASQDREVEEEPT
ncbi:MAG TPA: gas vesicle protein GvpG [Acidimicrobiales bacterium]|nr:gas vesicle protein GvpG [Acidimicrobiales bacterium]